MSEPKQKPGSSKQDYGTPWALIRAIEARWGKLTIDLAARADNAKAPEFVTPEEDSLRQNWATRIGAGLGWLNPPFGDIAPWAHKCQAYRLDASIAMLTPASIGSEWFAQSCENKGKVVGLRPRLKFEGCKDPYPKDCMLTLWGSRFDAEPMFQTWRWDAAITVRAAAMGENSAIGWVLPRTEDYSENVTTLTELLTKARELISDGWDIRDAVYACAPNGEADAAAMKRVNDAGWPTTKEESLSVIDRAIAA